MAANEDNYADADLGIVGKTSGNIEGAQSNSSHTSNSPEHNDAQEVMALFDVSQARADASQARAQLIQSQAQVVHSRAETTQARSAAARVQQQFDEIIEAKNAAEQENIFLKDQLSIMTEELAMLRQNAASQEADPVSADLDSPEVLVDASSALRPLRYRKSKPSHIFVISKKRNKNRSIAKKGARAGEAKLSGSVQTVADSSVPQGSKREPSQDNTLDYQKDNFDYSAYVELKSRLSSTSKEMSLEPNSVLQLGQYRISSPRNTEPIEWIVLKEEKGFLMLISKYILDSVPFNTNNERGSSSWLECSLRVWLNESFYQDAFSIKEKGLILTSSIESEARYGGENSVIEATEDKVFLLSVDQALRLFPNDEARATLATPFAVTKGVQVCKTKLHEAYWSGKSWWWLRSCGNTQGTVADVGYYGKVFFNNVSSWSGGGVRPCIWIKKTERLLS